MRLNELTRALPTILAQVGGDVSVHGVAADSRRVTPGALFVAIPGVTIDGRRFIPDAVDNGAVAIVSERPPQELQNLPWGAFTYIRVPDAREALGWLSAAYRGFPSRRMTLIGVTGTDGKTTTVSLIHSILQAAGINSSMISTVKAQIGSQELDTGLHTTTPDAPLVQEYLAQMVEHGTTHAVLEVTSHGLAQHRVTGCDFDVAVVTNITHDHLDFHGSISAYQEAKSRLFQNLTRSFRKEGVAKAAILNADDDSFRYLSQILPADQQIVYALQGSADLVADDISFAPDRTRFVLRSPQGMTPVETALTGRYNISNILAAAAAGFALGISIDSITQGIASVPPVPGRMEYINEGQDYVAIVDFAHTPNALQNALETARTMIGQDGGRVIVTFGCAGLRDSTKRRTMGQIAGAAADIVIVTAEDPRTEKLDDIIEEITSAALSEGKHEGTSLWRIRDRGQAIRFACQQARAGDVVIACGKGHEQSMCFGTVEHPWDDRVAMRRAIHGDTLENLPTFGEELEEQHFTEH
ncbi:MAG: UDP-N-acetylmuramoyl-L-alanyl-D-glutamate--2,6-diaminopimelate ligase [Anaerolineae bacterium]|nr:UDP-N-acetylmuramoyl-L-alanyl-D-glutamate--2,6-diaminopimelate ligase [Anaerolineae bacterium]